MFSKGLIKESLDFDWTKYPNIIILTIIYFISRVPFINSGFGVDPDAWRIANSALDLNQLHIYNPSRFPGYPVPEYFNSIIISHGWIATNSLTMILSFISVLAFALILNELKVKNRGLLVITYAFLPIIWINSTNTMDYMWALTFILLSWLFIIKKNYILAGMLLGLAVGSRVTSIILIFPFIYFIIRGNKKITKETVYFSLVTLLTTFILFLPLILNYKLDFLIYYPAITSDFHILTVLNQLGILALAYAVIIFLLSLPRFINQLRNNDKLTVFLLFEVSIVFLLYLGAPYEVGYLIPAIPFMLLLLNDISKRKLFIIFCVLLLLNSFISINLTKNSEDLVKKGVLLDDADTKDKLVAKIGNITQNMRDSMVISAEYFPMLYYFNAKGAKSFKDEGQGIYWNHEKNVGYVYYFPQDKVVEWQREGYKIYYMGNSAIDLTKLNYNYDLGNYNYLNAFNVY